MRRTSLILLAFLLGCADDLPPRALLDGYRVLGIAAEPPEARVDDAVAATVADALAEGARYAWSLCLFSYGADAEYACEDEPIPLPATGPALTLDLAALGVPDRLDALARAQGSDLDAWLAAGHPLWLVLQSGPPDAPVRTVKRVTLRSAPANHNPRLDRLEVPADVQADATIELAVTAGGEETYTDVTGTTAEEVLLFTWYTTGGTLDPHRTAGPDRSR